MINIVSNGECSETNLGMCVIDLSLHFSVTGRQWCDGTAARFNAHAARNTREFLQDAVPQ